MRHRLGWFDALLAVAFIAAAVFSINAAVAYVALVLFVL